MKSILTTLFSIALPFASLHAQDDGFTIEVNGVVTTDIEDDTDAAGTIGIQHHGEKGQTYMFRNLRIKELK